MTARCVRPTLALAIAAAVVVSAANAGRTAGARSSCKPVVSPTRVLYCGPATATLSVFPGVVFRHGTCQVKTTGGRPALYLVLGVGTTNRLTNNGMPFFVLNVTGPLQHPLAGGVSAFSAGKRWAGIGVSFNGNAGGGTFVVRGIHGSSGVARGGFRCS
jgi:hypothetical protein